MKDLSDDRATREILKNSYLELTDPEFRSATMKKIFRDSRRRRIRNNILIGLQVFVATDAIIYLLLRLAHLNVFELANRSAQLVNGIIYQAGVAKETVGGNHLAAVVLVSLAGITALFLILEFGLNTWKEHRRGA